MTKALRVFQLIIICQGLNKTQVIFSLLLNKQLAAISMGLLAITTAGCWEKKFLKLNHTMLLSPAKKRDYKDVM